MKDRVGHLNEEQIIDSVIEGGGLTEEQRRHLETCPLCSEQRGALRSELDRLGRMAADYTPKPQNRPVISIPEFRLLTFRRTAFAAGFAVALLVFLLWGPAFFSDPEQELAVLSNGEEMALLFVEDILEESASPYLDLDVAATSDAYFDEEFMELLVPTGEYNDSV